MDNNSTITPGRMGYFPLKDNPVSAAAFAAARPEMKEAVGKLVCGTPGEFTTLDTALFYESGRSAEELVSALSQNWIKPGFLYSYTPLGEAEVMNNAANTKRYYESMLLLGDTPQDILETIVVHLDEGPVKLSEAHGKF